MGSYVARWALLIFAIVLIIILRSPQAVLQPSLEAEDGTFIFPYYYAHRGADALLRFQAGYLSLGMNLIAYLSVRLPTPFIQYGFAWLPLLLAIVSYVWLFGSRFGKWLGSDMTRALVCVLFVLAPLAQYHIYANTTYSIWTALFLLVLLVVTPLSPITWRNVVTWATVNGLIWSNPLSILVGPLVLIRLVRERRGRLLHVLTLLNLALYNTVGVEKGAIFLGLTWLEALVKFLKAIGWTFVIVAGTAFRTVFGAPLFEWAESGFWPAIAVWAVGVAIAAVIAGKQSQRLRPVLFVLGYVIFAFTFVSVLSRGPSILVPLNGAPRYIYLPTLAFIVMFVLLLDHFVISKQSRRRTTVYAAVVFLYVALNAQLGHYFVATGLAARPPGRPQSPYLQSDAGNGRIVENFFAELARLEARSGSRKNIYLMSDKPGDWPIIADTRSAPR